MTRGRSVALAFSAFLGCSALCLGAPAPDPGAPITVGSKVFTESVVLGEIATQLLRARGLPAVHQRQLGGTQILWRALVTGEIDLYPEYTGTIREEILVRGAAGASPDMAAGLAAHGVHLSRPLGFNNTYAIGMKEETAARLGIETISDLRRHPDLVFGFSNEFMDRKDGWPALRDRYGLTQANVRGLSHDLAYRGLSSSAIHATDLYSTDPEIAAYHLRVLRDDLGHFPPYEAVFLYRADLERRAPAAVAALHELEGRLSEAAMIELNRRTRMDRVSDERVAADFLAKAFGIEARVNADTLGRRLARRTQEHLMLVVVSLGAAILVALPLGILAARRPRVGQVILGAAGILQTVPSLALLVFLIPLLGIGAAPAAVALFLYSLLPIIRNTHAGLTGIPISVRESAEALGLPPGARLRRVELPMASGAILAGIQTSAVINVGTATLGALIGAGGYGQPILTGIRLDDVGLILEGAVPAAALALAVQGLFSLAEGAVVPKGLRLQPEP